MKKLFVAVLAVAGLAACNTEETVLVQGPAPIAFDGSFVETRALNADAEDPSITTEEIDGFDVWGFMESAEGQIFNREHVTGTKGNFTYANTQYWVPGKQYYFAATAPAQSGNIVLTTPATGEAAKLGLGVVDFTVTDGAEDFLYSAVGPIDAPAAGATTVDPVKFEFNHMLSKVKFTFTNGFDNELATIDVTNVRMEVPSKGTIKLDQADWWSTNQWVLTGDKTTLAFGDACTKLGIGNSDEAAYERIIFPADATQSYTVTFDVKLWQGGVEAYAGTKTVVIENVALEIGKAYNFKAELNAKNITEDGSELLPIVFDVELVKDWVTAETPDAQVEEAEFRAAVALGGKVTLTKDIELTKSLIVPDGVSTVIDLNGFDIINNTTDEALATGDGIVVYGDLTIEGEGTVKGLTRCIWARGNTGATVTINGGHFIGANGVTTEVIYASGNGKIVINGGKFEAVTEDTVSFAAPQYAVLNLYGNGASGCDIVVYGGSFKNFDPADNISENPKHNFCAAGYKSVANGEWFDVVAE